MFTLPLTSSVQSPAGITIPALATEAADKTAPATANLILLFIKFSYCKKIEMSKSKKTYLLQTFLTLI
jgi:phosphoribosylcarboxyaminoimidazole (NCAIR) mutase